MYGTVCSLLLVAIVAFYTIKNDTGPFALHPILMTVGFSLLGFEAVWQFTNSASAFFNKSNTRANKIGRHRVLHYVAVACIVIAFVIIYGGKIKFNKPHFQTWHGLIGLVATALYTAQTIFGGVIMLRPPPNGISFATVKFMHAFGGCSTLLLASAALVIGFHSNFFEAAMAAAAFDIRPVLYALVGISATTTVWKSVVRRPAQPVKKD